MTATPLVLTVPLATPMVDSVSANQTSSAEDATSVLLGRSALVLLDVQLVTAVPSELGTTSVTPAMASASACQAYTDVSVVHVSAVIGTSPAADRATAMAEQMSAKMKVDDVCSAETTLVVIIAQSVAVVTMETHHQTLPLAAALACVQGAREADTNMQRLANWTSDPTKSLAIAMRDIQV